MRVCEYEGDCKFGVCECKGEYEVECEGVCEGSMRATVSEGVCV